MKKYVYSWIGLVIGIPVALVVGLAMLYFAYIQADYQSAGLFLGYVVIGPLVAVGVAVVFALYQIVTKHKKDSLGQKIKLLVVNMCAVLILIPLPPLMLVGLMTGHDYPLVLRATEYRRLVKIESVGYRQLDRNKNGLYDTLQVSFNITSTVPQPIGTHMDVYVKDTNNQNYLLRTTNEFSGYQFELGAGRYTCQANLMVPEGIDITKELAMTTQRLQIQIQDAQNGPPAVPYIQETDSQVNLVLGKYDIFSYSNNPFEKRGTASMCTLVN